MTKEQEQEIKLLDHNLSVQILLESMLYSHICENYDSMRKVNPILANIVRNDLQALHRNHSHYIDKISPLLPVAMLTDFEKLRDIINEFINEKTN